MHKTLAAAAAALALTLPAQAEMKVRTLHQQGSWAVLLTQMPEGTRSCVAATTNATGEQFSLSAFAGNVMLLNYIDKPAFPQDGETALTLRLGPKDWAFDGTAKGGWFRARFTEIDRAIAFMGELRAAQEITVPQADKSTRFPLTETAPALGAFIQCWKAISTPTK
ncbi:hypothetical protein IV417_13990 [Alphaproteobacteria bacterium KMM 3653]|uniref:Invasion associated locus B family protein n=1 Tax=Harenicola maris TaxID=2841044 RepID=A0AAP2G912_9RHOB|nr:hypothetical protein [Harenicola maris]